jgi:phage recombination protein Bet
MTTLVPAAARDLTPAQLTMVRETMAKDCNDREFNLFMAVCQRTGLDPIKRQISCMVHNKDKPDKRQLTIIVQIDGLRVIAKRSGDYRPMETAPLYEFDERVKDEATNPLGLVRVEVRAWKRYGDEWFPVVGEAYWSEFAPLKDEWQNNQKTGRKVLSGKWGDMPRLMLAKCAEAQALRRGWPDDMSGLYAEEEFDRLQVIDVTPTEIIEQRAAEQRQARLGGSESVMLCVALGEPLERVGRGMIIDRLFELYREAAESGWIEWFRKTNAESLKQAWAWHPGDALEAKRFSEQRIEILREEERTRAEADKAHAD